MQTDKKTPQPKYIQASMCEKLPINVTTIKRYSKNKKEYYNYPVAFDIETSNFSDNGELRACMYVWQMCFGDSDCVVVGRTWEEWLNFIKLIRKTFRLKKDRILVIYIHNLSYEAQFIRKMFEWEKIFALDVREPLYMRTKFGIEFRCSYKLSGYSLETLAKNLLKHDMQKMIGNLDYKKIRHSKTPITEEEMLYNIMDVKIVCAYISERLEIDGNITKIPLTKTGYVRNSCKLACFGNDHKALKYFRYRETMKKLTMESNEYIMLKSAFMGGYTHANSFYVGEIMEDVTSYDFTSSYPYVLFSEKYPWSKGELCYPDIEEVMEDLNTFCWILEVKMYNVESKIIQDDFLSYSKCLECKGCVLNNGRVNRADYIHIIITSVDLEIIFQTYKFYGGIEIIKAYKYYKNYLPTDFINEMLSYYIGKTTLKGVNGKEEEYLNSKEQLNSCYGMIVTNPLRPTIDYKNNEWVKREIDLERGITHYNNSINRFMPYAVGVFVTAYARKNLWSGILSCGSDYVYSDTDSIKLINCNKHINYFNEYNNEVIKKLEKACKYHNITWESVAPKTIKGVEKVLGVWDCESTTPGTPTYSRFKTLGAKRYMVEDYTTKDISLTVSGLNKKKAIPYLLDKYGRDKIFEAFTDDEYGIDNLVVPQGFSGRMVSTYIDEETEGIIIDYLGNKGVYHELSSVNLNESTYTLSLSEDYIKFLLGIKREVLM